MAISDSDRRIGKWRVHFVDLGDAYGKDDSLICTRENLGRYELPLVEFYDMSQDAKRFPQGQFVSRYYMETSLGLDTRDEGIFTDSLLARARKGERLSLYGGVPSWTLTNEETCEIGSYLLSTASRDYRLRLGNGIKVVDQFIHGYDPTNGIYEVLQEANERFKEHSRIDFIERFRFLLGDTWDDISKTNQTVGRTIGAKTTYERLSKLAEQSNDPQIANLFSDAAKTIDDFRGYITAQEALSIAMGDTFKDSHKQPNAALTKLLLKHLAATAHDNKVERMNKSNEPQSLKEVCEQAKQASVALNDQSSNQPIKSQEAR